MNKAVFLDRDGVINANVLNTVTGEWESPHQPEDFALFPWAIAALRQLQEDKFRLILVSNQPSYAKGKTSLSNLEAIQARFHAILLKHKVHFDEYYYCYHHPQGVVSEFAIECPCRKPGTFFLEEAKQKYSLDMALCWMIGDRAADIDCGQRAGVKTILVLHSNGSQAGKIANVSPDFRVKNLSEAVVVITEWDGRH